MKFHLEIKSTQNKIVELSVGNQLDNEELAEVFMTVFQDMLEQYPMVLRVVFFSSMECLRDESELVQRIWEEIQKESSKNKGS